MSLPIKPCLCRDWLEGDTAHMIAEAKVDGVRVVVEVGECVRAWTRNGNPVTLPVGAELDARLVGHAVLDCELVGDTLHVFDLPGFGGSWRVRREALKHAFSRIPKSADVALVPVLHDPELCDGYPEDTATLLERATAAGFEGLVLKDPDAAYSEGQRAWAKVKPESTEDLRVVDVLANGSLVVSRKGVSVTVGIGLPRAVRAAAAAMLGRLVEVRFQQVTAAGSLRHPVFVRVRDDKAEVN